MVLMASSLKNQVMLCRWMDSFDVSRDGGAFIVRANSFGLCVTSCFRCGVNEICVHLGLVTNCRSALRNIPEEGRCPSQTT